MRFFHVSRHDLGETVTMEVKLPWMCERKVRVINNVSEIDSKIMLTIAKNVRITYTPNSVEAFRETKFKKGNQNV